MKTEAYEQLLKRQKAFFHSGKSKELNFRIDRLNILRKTIIKRNQEIMEALNKDFGKCEFEAFTNEILNVLDEIKLAAENLQSWAAPRKVKTPIIHFLSSSKVYHEPYGTVLVMSAWNYPFQLAMNPLVGAIAAGNCCILKPSELAPNTSNLLSSLIKDCFAEEHCSVVEGGIEETHALLKENFDLIFYTGSTRVGKIIAQEAAAHLTPVVLEMGGKSPCIVSHKADIKSSAKRIAWGKFINAGQTCVAPDYVIVHKKVKPELVTELKKQITAFYGKEPEKSKDYCRIINQHHFSRLSAYLEDATILIGGKTEASQLYIEPTVIQEVTWEHPVMQEEIFGPILPIIEYENFTEVIDIVNSHERPLALYLFSKSKKEQKRIIKEASFGGGCFNTTILHVGNPYLPFGGIGNSGMGNYHGEWSFETFSHKKGVLEKSFLVDFKFLYPPYKNKVKWVKRIYLKK
ncbi:aldehyde dehydrogenase [Clostridium aminobutyricum]|uniref:Aldehyde dehydrogenase n=1 Tax=Clostridium aminobutyricum TaxID=33953 RepID=A0A939DAU7_CLOAM|nr:aldehyde dehydrogenase [Clostridium aminobutyricum]MBN7774436.1 aldehyde dehydrogenase [Clostridium aminobutyricum]